MQKKKKKPNILNMYMYLFNRIRNNSSENAPALNSDEHKCPLEGSLTTANIAPTSGE